MDSTIVISTKINMRGKTLNHDKDGLNNKPNVFPLDLETASSLARATLKMVETPSGTLQADVDGAI
jgi:hypothetical protein